MRPRVVPLPPALRSGLLAVWMLLATVRCSTDQGPGGKGPVGQTTDVSTKLPALPQLTNVLATENVDSTSITFEPFDGALDYRVYPLPADGDISVAADGRVIVKNAVYRCAGNREGPHPAIEDGSTDPTNWVTTKVNTTKIGNYTRSDADATVGYVYPAPGDGLVPVYVLGSADPLADDDCSYSRWAASRSKIYTTSTKERDAALAAFARDDGIAFYVPSAAADTTLQMYSDDSQWHTLYYFADGAEAAAHTKKTPLFSISKTQLPGSQPLMRVYYQNNCGLGHDELVVGKERFNRAYHQGDQLPNWQLLWTGLTGPTTLVVEALDGRCPYQAQLAAQSMPAIVDPNGGLNYQAWSTIEDVRAASPDGEVFINGQAGLAWDKATGATTTPLAPSPKAIARAFVKVAPTAAPKMDFFETFAPGSTLDAFTNVPNTPGINCSVALESNSIKYNMNFICPVIADWDKPTTHPYISVAPVLGELWLNYADAAADTNGKFRLTPKQKATMGDSSYLHVTMEVDMLSTARRYPQILISDVDAPVQSQLDKGHTLVVQPRAGTSPWADYPINYELQVCNLRTWDVNFQCPLYDFHNVRKANGDVDHLMPNAELGESASVDHRARFDVYASTKRAYLFFEGQPFACADLPSGQAPSGPVTVTWGDVLYHSGVDNTYQFHKDHLQTETKRHFDNLGFSSGVGAPAWDETRLPCVAASELK